jgi:hypothetical protein
LEDAIRGKKPSDKVYLDINPTELPDVDLANYLNFRMEETAVKLQKCANVLFWGWMVAHGQTIWSIHCGYKVRAS